MRLCIISLAFLNTSCRGPARLPGWKKNLYEVDPGHWSREVLSVARIYTALPPGQQVRALTRSCMASGLQPPILLSVCVCVCVCVYVRCVRACVCVCVMLPLTRRPDDVVQCNLKNRCFLFFVFCFLFVCFFSLCQGNVEVRLIALTPSFNI